MAVKVKLNDAIKRLSIRRAVDKAIKALDEEERWITVNGSHIKVDENGNPIAGNKKVISAMKKGNNRKKNVIPYSSIGETEMAEFLDMFYKDQDGDFDFDKLRKGKTKRQMLNMAENKFGKEKVKRDYEEYFSDEG